MPELDPPPPGQAHVPTALARAGVGVVSPGDSTLDGDPASTLAGADPHASRDGSPATPHGVPVIGARFGRFEIIAELGAGAMGVVMLARDVELTRRVAIKFLSRKIAADDAGKLRLLREAQAVARLQHPNVVAVHDVGNIGEQIFVVMEYVDGGTLRQWSAAAPRPWQEIVDVYIQAALGLEAAHQAGFVHRDFKPDNALIGSDGRVRVSDFGLVTRSMAALGDTPADLTLTRPGAVLGTPAYMAPEQFAGSDVGPAADQFALCVGLFEALYGTRPFAGVHFMQILASIESGTLSAPTRDDVPMQIHGAIIRGVARDPALRHPSMRALAEALRWRPPALPSRRRRGPVVAVVGVAASLVVAASVGAWWWSGDAPTELGVDLRSDSSAATSVPSAPAVTAAPEPSWSCGAGAAVDAAWNPALGRTLHDAFVATGSSSGADAAQRTIATLAEYTAALRKTIDTTCRAPSTDPALVRRAEACFANTIDALGGTVDVLTQSPTVANVESSVLLATGLPMPTRCGDPTTLLADGSPPSRPLEELSPVRRKLWASHAQLQSGELDRAVDLIDETRDALADLNAPALVALSAFVRAHVAIRRLDAAGNQTALAEALAHTRAAGDLTYEAIVLADLLRSNVDLFRLDRIAEAEALAEQLRVLLPKTATDSRWYGHGALAFFAGFTGRVADADAEATAEIDGLAALAFPRAFELGVARLRRAYLRHRAGRSADALVDAEQALVDIERAVGAGSVHHASARTEVGYFLAIRGDRIAGRAHLDAARRVLEHASSSAQVGLSGVLVRFADLERTAEDYDAAARSLDDALTITKRADTEDKVASIETEVAAVEFLRAHYALAGQAIERAVAITDRFPQSVKFDRVRLAEVRALVAHGRGDFAEAIAFATQRLALIEAGAGARTAQAVSARIDIGELHIGAGDCDQAHVAFGHALEVRDGLGLGPDLDLARLLAGQARCDARRGDVAAARDKAHQVAALPEPPVPTRVMAPRLAMIEAEIALAEHDEARARTEANKAGAAYAAMGSAWVRQQHDVESWIAGRLGTGAAGGAPKR